MYFLQKLHEQEIYRLLKTGSETEFLTSSGTSL